MITIKKIIKNIAPYGLIKRRINKSLQTDIVDNSIEFKNATILVKPNICIFACYTDNKVLPETDIYYIKELSKLFTVIVIGDCIINEPEIDKIKDYVYYAKFIRHRKYDFGSYFIGYKYACDNNLLTTESSLLLTNDSIIGPIYDLNPIIKSMNEKKCDFWGLTDNVYCQYHLQSYFLYFKKQILQTKYLYEFLNKVKVENSKNDVVLNYEFELTKFLISKNFKCISYTPSRDANVERFNAIIKKNKYVITAFPILSIEKYKFPFIKKVILINKYSQKNLIPVVNKLKDINYSLYTVVLKEYFTETPNQSDYIF